MNWILIGIGILMGIGAIASVIEDAIASIILFALAGITIYAGIQGITFEEIKLWINPQIIIFFS